MKFLRLKSRNKLFSSEQAREPKIVGVITPARFPGSTGDTINFMEIIKGLSSQGCHVFLLCPKNPQADNQNSYGFNDRVTVNIIPDYPPRLEEIRGKVNFKMYLKYVRFLLVESLYVMYIIRKYKIRRVFLRHHILTLQLPVLFRLIRIRRVVADGEFAGDLLQGVSPIILKFLRLYEKKIMNMYSFFKVSSYSQASPLGLSREKILLSPVSINIEDVPKFPLSDIPPLTFGYFGGLESWQGVDFLLRAFTLLVNKIPSAKLYIIGEGTMLEDLQNYVRDNHLLDNVSFIGRVPRDKLWSDYFKKFQVLVIPRPKQNNSIDSVLPIKLIESLAAGKAIIACDIPIMREIPNNAVLLVESFNTMALSEAMEFLSTDEVEREKYSQRALSASKNYDIKMSIEKLMTSLFSE